VTTKFYVLITCILGNRPSLFVRVRVRARVCACACVTVCVYHTHSQIVFFLIEGLEVTINTRA